MRCGVCAAFAAIGIALAAQVAAIGSACRNGTGDGEASMRISSGVTANFANMSGPARDRVSVQRSEPVEQAGSCLPAVIPVARTDNAAPPQCRTRPVATLLAQLVAGAQDLPATRARRRADAAEGALLYRTGTLLQAPGRRGLTRIV
jgi:hypothetical protein